LAAARSGACHWRTGSGIGKEFSEEALKLWRQMFHEFHYHSDAFLAHYHQRNNVESVFSMVKRKFGGDVRSKTETAMLNEVICKFVCHNICVIISAMFELGLDLDSLLAPKVRKPNFQVIPGGLAYA
jgi:hypothetical protein